MSSVKINSQTVTTLLHTLKTTSNDSIRIETLIQLSNQYRVINQDTAIMYAKKALEIEKKNPNDLFNYKIQSSIGNSFSFKEELDSAFFYLNKAKTIAKNAKLKDKEAGTLINLGIVYSKQRKFEKALNQYYKAKKYFETEGNDVEAVSMIINNISIILQDQDRFEEAISYHKKNLALLKKNNLTSNLASIYTNISSNLVNLQKLDSAIYYAKLGIKYSNKDNDNYGLALAESIIANAYRKQKKLTLSKELFTKAIIHYKKIDTILSIDSLIDLADLLQNDLNDTENAEKYYLEAKKYVTNIQDKNNLDRIYYGLGTLYRTNKKYKLAANYLEKRINLHDSIYVIKRDQKVADILAKYETKEKEQKIKLLNEGNKTKKEKLKVRNLIIVSLFLLILTVLIIAYLLKQKSAQKLEKMENELQKYLLQIKDLNDKTVPSSKELSNKYELTERETEILDLLNKGMSYAVIGENIFISKNTVKYHLKNIYLKLDVKNRIEALNKIKS